VTEKTQKQQSSEFDVSIRVHQKNKGCEIELSGLPICFTGRYITAVKIISLLKVI